MSESKAKNLTLAKAKQKAQQFNERKLVHLDDNYSIEVDKKFAPSKIQLFSVIWAKLINAMVEGEAVLNDEDLGKLFAILLIENFSSLVLPAEIEKKIDAYDILLDAGYLHDILNAFDADEVKKIGDILAEQAEAFKEYTQKLEIENAVLEEKIKQAQEKVDVEESEGVKE